MTNRLEKNIIQLHEFLNGTYFNDFPHILVKNIIVTCGENANPQAIQICLSIFFKKEKNILTFLRKAISKDELRACKVELLQFLHRFIISAGNQILPYAVSIKDTCVSLFNSDKYSDVRSCTFPIISKLLELAKGNGELIEKLNLEKLVEVYFLSLVNQSKLSSSLKAHVLTILGLMCRYHPEVMIPQSNKCLTLFLNTLKAEIDTKNKIKPDLNVIAGALDGLNHYLSNFSPSENDDKKSAKNIFDYAKKALLGDTDDVNRYAMPRAALDLLAKHAEQFDTFIYEDYKDLFERISQWAQHKNYDMKKLGYIALDSYYKQLAEMLKKMSETEKEKCKRIFTYFIQKFYKSLTEDKEKDLKETVIAIKGYGAFAGPCREFMEAKDVRLMFKIIIEICERTFFLNQQQHQQIESQGTEIFDEKVYQLPSFIESLAYLCNQIDDNLPEGSYNTLEKLIMLAIDNFPKLIKRYNYQISLAIARLLIAIQVGKANFYTEFVSRIIYQSMARIFSYKTNYYLQQEQFEKNQKVENNNDSSETQAATNHLNLHNITSNDYVLLWSNLLNLNEFKELNTIGVHINERKRLVTIIYDEFIETLIKIMKKLDLNASKLDGLNETPQAGSSQSSQNDGSHVSSNPVIGLRPSKPKDYEILVNLVDFSRELLMQKHFEFFEKWLFKFSKEIILLSSKYSLISGFYKLNTLCMRIAIKIGYFNKINETIKKTSSLNTTVENIDNDTDESFVDSFNESLSETDKSLQYEKLNCFFLYKKFIKEIFVRIKQFKDELLASCLEFLLSLPKELVVCNLDEVFDSLQISLDMGINYLPVAENALTSLEYWFNNIKLEKLKPYFSLVLNKFDDYLQINKFSETEETKNQEKILSLKLTYNGRGRKKLPIKYHEKNYFSMDQQDSDLYEKIQVRILKLIGQLAGEMSHCLFETNITKQIISWDTVQHLKFYVPFVDMKPAVYFDKFLPRIIYLALSSTNRQTKVNACELLHSIVIYMIGKNVSDSQSLSSSAFQMNKIYKNVYPALFKLACDVDNFARNLFQPLVMQIIHWFTGNRKYESLETIALLETIMECLVDEKEAALRDFSALALNEFLKWSIKHTPLTKQEDSLSSSSVNVKSILKRMFSLLKHPSRSKRLGAALAWNSIYIIFREEESLVNKYIFDLLYHLIESLALAEHDDKSFGTQEQTKLGLDHVERIMRAKMSLLNSQSEHRVKPIGWSVAVLEVAVRWLVRQCGRRETECRHKSMDLVYKLAPCITGIKDTKEYFKIKFEKETETHFLERFEGSSEKKELLKDNLSNYKTLKDLIESNTSDTIQLSCIQNWLEILIAPLDCYTWVFGQRLLTPKDLFEKGKSCIWISLQYFIDNIVNVDLVELIKRNYELKNKTECSDLIICTPNESENYHKVKCTALIRLLDFLCSMLGMYPNESVKIIPEKIWSDSFFTCIVNICLEPYLVGFDLNDLEVSSQLPIKTRTFLKLFTQQIPSQIQNKFKAFCKKLFDDQNKFKNLITSIQSSSSAANENKMKDWLKLSQLVTGYEQLSEFNIYSISLDFNRIIFDYVCESLSFSNSFEQESLSCVDAKRKLLSFCLNLNFLALKKESSNVKDYLIEILDKYLFFSNQNTKILTFYAYYKNEICSWICKRYELVLKYVLNKLSLNFAKCISLIINLIEYLASDKHVRKTYGSKIVNFLYENWSMYREFWQTDTSDLESKTLMISLLTKCCFIELIPFDSNAKSSKHISEMYMSLLVDPKTKLNFKCKVLDLLYVFAESPSPYQIKNYLSQFITQFPLKSTELIKGDEIYTDYINAIRKILISIELSSSLDLVNTIVNIICREAQHICDEEIKMSLISFIKRLESSKQSNVIFSFWENFFSKASDDERKFWTFKKVIYNFLNSCEKPIFMEFLCTNINYLLNILEIELKETNFEYDFFNKRCVFELLELAYKRLHKDEIFNSNSKLCITFETSRFGQNKDGKELTKEILKKCRKFLCNQIKFNLIANTAKFEGYLRQLHCAAYNCLVALFIRTQKEPRLYSAYLFKDDENKMEFIFEPLIDKTREYKFSIEIENFQERKKKFISLRNEFKENSNQPNASVNYINSINSMATQINQSNQQISYLNTQNMYESSLSEELSIFDFTGGNSASLNRSSSLSSPVNSSFSSSQQSEQQFKRFLHMHDGTNENEEQAGCESMVELELDDLNQHESMEAFVALLQSLVINNITPLYEKDQQPKEMPPWMEFLFKKVSSDHTNENVKLFIIKGLLNTQNIFTSYAKFWYTPLITFLVNSSFSREETIDYFTLDVMVLLLSWHSICLPSTSEKKMIKRLFENLMRRCYHENRQILKNNLELLKTIAECWKDFVEVPVRIIFDFLKSEDQKKLTSGIQLFGLVLANQIENYDYPNEVNNFDLFSTLIYTMKKKEKIVHAAGAEVVGMLMKNLKNLCKEDKDLCIGIEQILVQTLKELEMSLYITCVHRVQLNFPKITESQKAILVFNLPKLNGEFKIMCAESILATTEFLEDHFFTSPSFKDLIERREIGSLQLIALKIIYQHFLVKQKQLDINPDLINQIESEMMRLFPILCDEFIKHSNVACRYELILILILAFDIQAKKKDYSNADGLNCRKLTNDTLLKALLDEDQTIRVMAQNFWIEKANMPSSTIDRMVLILENMYSPQTEKEYLSYSTNLLLEKTSKSPDYNRFIYENPLSECVFREYNLSADWRRRHEMMTPLFIETVNSFNDMSFNDGNNFGFSYNQVNNNLRATQQQSLQFQPTQDVGKNVAKLPYNWITQSSVDTLQSSLNSYSYGESQSYLLFSHIKKQININQGSSTNTNIPSNDLKDILRLRRRFTKDKSTEQSKFFARKQIEKQSREEELKKQLKLKRSSHVEKYRKYRIGDFPDIQIKFSEIIAPFQALAQRDSQIAMMLFESLFGSILSEVSFLRNESETNAVIKNIEAHLNSMLTLSESNSPNFIACILEIGLKHAKSLRLDIASVSMACLNSLQQPLGIILLEEYLILNEINGNDESDAPPTTKRLKFSNDYDTVPQETLLWIELAKLYRSMNDYDSIKGIFEKNKTLTTEFTQQGFEHESNSDYYKARACYYNGLNNDWSENSQASRKIPGIEKDLWEQSFLRCCNELTDWSQMQEFSMETKNLSDLYKENTYTLENIFPYAFRSKIKLILQEKEEKEQKKHQDLAKFLENLDEDDKTYMETLFSQELALFYLHQKDFNASKYYANKAIQNYLDEWSAINKTIMQSRIKKLQSLQTIVELNEFLNFIESNQVFTVDLNRKVENLINLWSNSMPNKLSDPPRTWDDVITNRCIFYEYIQDKYYSEKFDKYNASNNETTAMNIDEDDEDDEHGHKIRQAKIEIVAKIDKSKYFMKIKFAEAAQFQGNNALALNKLKELYILNKMHPTRDVRDLQIAYKHCYLKTHLSKASSSLTSPEENLNKFFKSQCLTEILKYDECDDFFTHTELHKTHQLLHGQFCQFLVESFSNAGNNSPNYYAEFISDNKKTKQLTDYLKCPTPGDIFKAVEKIISHGVESLSKLKNDAKGCLEFSIYCDHYLRQVENEEEGEGSSNVFNLSKIELIKNEFPLIVVEQLLQAIRLNSYEARRRFPRLLQIVEVYKEQTIDAFIRSADKCPSWMFIGWLSQMTALLDKPEAKAIFKIIENISIDYPQAIVYPFKMSLESFKFNYKTKEQEAFVNKIKTKLDRIPLVNQFVAALEQLNTPELLFKDYYGEIYSSTKENHLKIFPKMYYDLIDFSSQEESNANIVEWGNIRKNFSKKLKKLFEEEFGQNAELLLSMSETTIKEKTRKIMGTIGSYTSEEGNLGHFSPWLVSFKRNFSKDLEIPGQYSGKSKPLPEYHVKIESFDERIMTMSSVRKPKCITIRGCDQRDHKFLVKCGEDQRQDERIETLFEVINDLLKSDPRCYQRNLSIKTYQVIPMTNKLAFIEWLSDTKTLQSVIHEAKTEEENKIWESNDPRQFYFSKINEFVKSELKELKNSNPTTENVYGAFYKKCKRKEVNILFDQIQSKIPPDLLRRYVRSMSSSTEGYFVLRNQFISSYAVASTASYILGIGDRHLNNILIDTKTGQAINIDFGMAFGHSVVNLQVPELMPIRLTRQILKLIAPLEDRGLFESCMNHTMRALRENNDLLMCILDVFIKEPSIDWIGNAIRIEKKNLEEKSNINKETNERKYTSGVAYAKGRINSARNKLIGINPCVIVRNDLMSGIHKKSQYLEYYINVATGRNERDKDSKLIYRRSEWIEKGDNYRLSIEDQVKCIIEQSVDTNILGRTYVGWEPFI